MACSHKPCTPSGQYRVASTPLVDAPLRVVPLELSGLSWRQSVGIATEGGRRQCGDRDFRVHAPSLRCRGYARDLLVTIHFNIQAQAIRIPDLKPVANNFAEPVDGPNNSLEVHPRVKSKRNVANRKPFNDSLNSEGPVRGLRSPPSD